MLCLGLVIINLSSRLFLFLWLVTKVFYHTSKKPEIPFLTFFKNNSNNYMHIHIGEGNGTPLQDSCLENPWTEEPGRLQSMGSQSQIRLSDFTFTFHFHIREGTGNLLQCSCLENPRDAEPGGLLSMGSHRVRHHGSDLAAAAAAYIHIYTYVCVYRKIERYAISLTVEIRI